MMGGLLCEWEKNKLDLTTADTKIIGFDFQYFYFIIEIVGTNVIKDDNY